MRARVMQFNPFNPGLGQGFQYELASECRKQIKGFRKYLRDYNSKEDN